MNNEQTIIETLYYMLDIAIIKGHLNDAETYLKLLRKKYLENSENFKILEEDNRLQNLQTLGEIVDKKLVVKSFEFQNYKFTEIKKDSYTLTEEKQLQKIIFNNQQILQQCLNTSNDFKITCCYVHVEFGIIDLIADKNKIRYVIELKKDEAKFDVIEQIHKYMCYYNIRLNFKLWNKVKGIVIANNFQDYALQELIKANITCIKYSYKNNILELTNLNP